MIFPGEMAIKNEEQNQFKKGQSGNPAGKKKGTRNRSTIARKWLEALESVKNPITGEIDKLSQEDIITLAMIKKARKGDSQAYRALMDSGFGAPKQEIKTEQATSEIKVTVIKGKKKKK